MRKLIPVLFMITLAFNRSIAQWKPVAGKIATEWAAKVDPQNTLPEYPRPLLVRKDWTNLNGLWQYFIAPVTAQDQFPVVYTGNILVPFAIESSLSGVGKSVGKDSVLWYTRSFDLPGSNKKGKTLLHFGAVDWSATIYLNGARVGEHQGGYDAFTIDITQALKKSGKQILTVKVWDPADEGPQPRGKQQKNPEGIWYTSVSGIWQTVWLETVPQTYIVATRQTPDIDKQQLTISAEIASLQPGDQLEVSILDARQLVKRVTGPADNPLILEFKNPRLWSPNDPFLYDLTVRIMRKGKPVDQVGSYVGMRKSSMARDANGLQRTLLNNEFLFQYGPLDQGWWPDGLYTAPTDDALKFDIQQTKALGFDLIRKHVKVESARWYYHCDKIGILVWQDMPSGDMGGNVWDSKPGYVSGGRLDKERSPESEAIYRREWKAIMDQLYNNPSIIAWVPFNECWGQFKTKEIVDWTMQHDPSRLVNAASGGNYFLHTGQIFDLHNYPEPQMPDPRIFANDQIVVLGEFGGLGLPVEGHTWLQKGNWGYQTFKDQQSLFTKYTEFVDRIPKLISMGLSAAIYTQTTDVEMETNGLFTYDRKILKMPLERMHALHQQLYNKALVK